MEGSGRRAEGWRMAVIMEGWQRETKMLRIKSLRDRVPLSARGTLPHREVPRH
jgi:hypothetical protein